MALWTLLRTFQFNGETFPVGAKVNDAHVDVPTMRARGAEFAEDGVVRDVTTSVKSFAEVTVPTGTPAALSGDLTFKAKRGVLVQSLAANSAAVFLGDSSVTSGTGIELAAGKAVMLEVDDVADVFCVAGVAGQKLRVLAL